MSDISAKKLGEILRHLRKSHGYTQVDVAVAINVTQPTYSLYEKGETRPTTDGLYRLAKYYDVLIDDIIRKCVELDEEMLFDTADAAKENCEREDFLSFINKKKYKGLAPLEQEMLFNFNKLDKAAMEELISFARFKQTL